MAADAIQIIVTEDRQMVEMKIAAPGDKTLGIQMDAVALDAHIRDLATARAAMEPAVHSGLPQAGDQIQATIPISWYVDSSNWPQLLVLGLCHASYGWLYFGLPPEYVEGMLRYFPPPVAGGDQVGNPDADGTA